MLASSLKLKAVLIYISQVAFIRQMDRLNPSRYKDSRLVRETDSYDLFSAVRISDEVHVSILRISVKPEQATTITAALERHRTLVLEKNSVLLDCYDACYMPADDCLLLELEPGFHETVADLLPRLKNSSFQVPEEAIWETVSQLAQAIAYCYNPLNNLEPSMWGFINPTEIIRMETGHIKLFNPSVMEFLFPTERHASFASFTPPECRTAPKAVAPQSAALWALGCVAWALADPRSFYSRTLMGDTAVDLPSYSAQLASMINSCLSLDPTQRPKAAEISSYSPAIKANARLIAHPTPLESSFTQPVSILGLFASIHEDSLEGFNRHKPILSQDCTQQETIEKAVSLCINLRRSKLLSILCECIAAINIRIRLKDFPAGMSAPNSTMMSPRNSLFADHQRDSVSSFSLAERTSLMNAAAAGNVELVREFLHEAGRQNTYGKTALMLAAEGGHYECVRLLLIEAGYVDLENKTALYYAYVGFDAPLYSCSNRESIGDRGSVSSSFRNSFMGSSAMPSLSNPFASGNISLAGRCNNPSYREDQSACISLLSTHEKDIIADDGTTLLMLLVEADCKDGVMALRELQGMQDSFGRTALARGLARGASYDTLLPLLDNEKEIPNPDETALTYAIREGFLEGVRQLIPSMSGIPNKVNLTPIEVARVYNRLDCEELLLAFEWHTTSTLGYDHLKCLIERQIYAIGHADKDVAEKLGRIVHTYWPQPQIARVFMEFEFPTHYCEIAQLRPDALDSHLNSAINLALKECHFEALPHLCERVAVRNARISLALRESDDVAEATSLINAALNNSEVELRLLLKRDSDLLRNDFRSSTSLDFLPATRGDAAALLQPVSPPSPPSLMEERGDTSMMGKSHNGMTALGAAASIGSVHCLMLLLGELGILPKNGMTALMYAAKYGRKECVRLLLAEAGQVNSNGETALILAAKHGHASCVEILMPFERRIRDKRGKTALQWAREKPYKTTASWNVADTSYEMCISILSDNASKLR